MLSSRKAQNAAETPRIGPASLFDPAGDISLLSGIEQSLRDMIEPALSGEPKHTASMMRRLVLDMAARHATARELAPMLRGAHLAAVDELIALASTMGGEGQDIATRLGDAPTDVAASEDLSRLLSEAFDDLAALHDPGANFSEALIKILAGLLKADSLAEKTRRDWADQVEAQVSPETCDSGIITKDRLELFLREAMPEHPDLAVSRVSRPPMGWGKVTLIAELEGSNLPFRSLVVRQDALLSGTGTHVADEYGIIKFVHQHGLEVPEPIFFHPGDDRFGRPFIIMTKLSGATAGGFGGPAPECTREALFGLARFAARLHALDPSESDLPQSWKTAPDEDANKRAVVKVRQQLRDNQVAPLPVASGTLLWLEHNAPPAPERPIIVHSDLGLWNLLVEGPRLSAVLDWELAQIGDPMQDLAYIRPLLGDRMTWDEFVEAYLAAGGQDYRPAAIEFFGILSDVRNVMFTEIMHHRAVSNVADVRTAHAVTTCLHMLERQAAAKLPGIDS
ncbi:Predicted kinase, aminoglycoside phosphotransferase (APT) family [Sphingopyxis sp. YR583]|uniref:phosphotransferase family protein n=1 Tax=Sphingopyxis sp. YR583 TaxID=1881047 RepID=UPI0008A77EF7|nr:phosphotransferase family protein [Sphingopyxis sp. YR583]SEH19160.1 Predicted kinase, aminoglycoside phosphotransferase (APT) family [Sphingopyxis sp. YR583]